MGDSHRPKRLRKQILNEVRTALGDKLFSEFIIDGLSEDGNSHHYISNLKSNAEIWLFLKHREMINDT